MTRNGLMHRAMQFLAPLGAAAFASGCAVGPDFHRPAAPALTDYTQPADGPDDDVPGELAESMVAAGGLCR
jgi:hypothetical protein